MESIKWLLEKRSALKKDYSKKGSQLRKLENSVARGLADELNELSENVEGVRPEKRFVVSGGKFYTRMEAQERDIDVLEDGVMRLESDEDGVLLFASKQKDDYEFVMLTKDRVYFETHLGSLGMLTDKYNIDNFMYFVRNGNVSLRLGHTFKTDVLSALAERLEEIKQGELKPRFYLL